MEHAHRHLKGRLARPGASTEEIDEVKTCRGEMMVEAECDMEGTRFYTVRLTARLFNTVRIPKDLLGGTSGQP